MRNLLPLLFICLTLFISCQQDENPDTIQAINESLEESSQFYTNESNELLYTMSQKESGLGSTQIAAKLWTPIAKEIVARSNGLHQKLDDLKKSLTASPNDFSSLSGAIGYQIYEAISLYATRVTDGLSYDTVRWSPEARLRLSEDRSRLSKMIVRQFSLFNDSSTMLLDSMTWVKRYVEPLSVQAGVLLLERLQHDLALVKQNLIEYCNSQIPSECHLMGEPLHVVAVANADQVQAGQTMTIIAGMGKYSFAVKPEFFIADKPIPAEDDGVATTRFRAVGKPGKYTIPVRVEHYALDGTRVARQKELEYIIAHE